jgi:hypothetical protein
MVLLRQAITAKIVVTRGPQDIVFWGRRGDNGWILPTSRTLRLVRKIKVRFRFVRRRGQMHNSGELAGLQSVCSLLFRYQHGTRIVMSKLSAYRNGFTHLGRRHGGLLEEGVLMYLELNNERSNSMRVLIPMRYLHPSRGTMDSCQFPLSSS